MTVNCTCTKDPSVTCMIHPRLSAKELFDGIAEADQRRKEAMPTEKDAIRQIAEAVKCLKDFGWNDIMYCHEERFHGLEFGMYNYGLIYKINGIDGYWSGEESYPSRPVLWKPIEVKPTEEPT